MKAADAEAASKKRAKSCTNMFIADKDFSAIIRNPRTTTLVEINERIIEDDGKGRG